MHARQMNNGEGLLGRLSAQCVADTVQVHCTGVYIPPLVALVAMHNEFDLREIKLVRGNLRHLHARSWW